MIQVAPDTSYTLTERENPSLILPLPKGEDEKDRVVIRSHYSKPGLRKDKTGLNTASKITGCDG
jgi:hypothetical protein